MPERNLRNRPSLRTAGIFDDQLPLLSRATKVVDSCEGKSDDPVERAKQIIDVYQILAAAAAHIEDTESESAASVQSSQPAQSAQTDE